MEDILKICLALHFVSYIVIFTQMCRKVRVKAGRTFSNEERTQVEAPRHKTLPKLLLHKDTDLDNSLIQSNRPDSSDLGIVSPVFKGVTLTFARNMKSFSSGL